MLAYIIFVPIFGPLYSVQNLLILAISGLANPFSLVSFLFRFYIISYFTLPLGYAFWSIRKCGGTGRWAFLRLPIFVLFLSAWGVFRSCDDLGTILSLVCFAGILMLSSLSRDDTPFVQTGVKNFLDAILLFYSTYFVLIFLALSPQIELESFSGLISFLSGPLGQIQALSLPPALVSAPIVMGVARKDRSDRVWYSFVSIAILSVSSFWMNKLSEALVFASLGAMVCLSYLSSSSLEPRLYKIKEKLKAEEDEIGGKEVSNEFSGFVKDISNSLNRLASEVELFREIKTGEVVSVQRRETYTPQLRVWMTTDGRTKSSGVKHYIVCSRTGHGKTMLVRNLMRVHRDFAYLVIDRHSEYEGTLALGEILSTSEVERIVAQLPTTELSLTRNILKETQIFNVEQQLDRALDMLSEELVGGIVEDLEHGRSVVIQPGRVPEMVFTPLTLRIIGKVFEARVSGGSWPGLVVVNEEAHNSFEVDEAGFERNRAHILVRLVLEGRKYDVSLVNVTSNPLALPRAIVDNSVLVLGSIGVPAVKKLVGEKLGMAYIRLIHELPRGEFFLDEVDDRGRYTIFPNHFGVAEFEEEIVA